MQTVGRFDTWVTPKTNRHSFCLILKVSHALDGLFRVLSRLHGHKHKCTFCWIRDHWTWLLSDIVAWDSFKHGTHYLFSDIDAVMATFHVLVNTYFLNFRFALMIVLRALVHLIYLVIFNSCLVFNFPFFNFEHIISFSLDKYSLLIFDVVLHYQLNAFKIPKMSSTTTDLSWFRSTMHKVHSPSSHLLYFPELFILQVKPS